MAQAWRQRQRQRLERRQLHGQWAHLPGSLGLQACQGGRWWRQGQLGQLGLWQVAGAWRLALAPTAPPPPAGGAAALGVAGGAQAEAAQRAPA